MHIQIDVHVMQEDHIQSLVHYLWNALAVYIPYMLRVNNNEVGYYGLLTSPGDYQLFVTRLLCRMNVSALGEFG